jgi:hypothetical protein
MTAQRSPDMVIGLIGLCRRCNLHGQEDHHSTRIKDSREEHLTCDMPVEWTPSSPCHGIAETTLESLICRVGVHGHSRPIVHSGRPCTISGYQRSATYAAEICTFLYVFYRPSQVLGSYKSNDAIFCLTGLGYTIVCNSVLMMYMVGCLTACIQRSTGKHAPKPNHTLDFLHFPLSLACHTS